MQDTLPQRGQAYQAPFRKASANAQQSCKCRLCAGGWDLDTMRFGSTAKALAECNLKYYRISDCYTQLLTMRLGLLCGMGPDPAAPPHHVNASSDYWGAQSLLIWRSMQGSNVAGDNASIGRCKLHQLQGLLIHASSALPSLPARCFCRYLQVYFHTGQIMSWAA